MSANPIQLAPPLEYVCACGKKLRVESQHIFGPYAPQPYQHNCGIDEEHYLLGPILTAYEERHGAWMVIGKYR
jgi:hypothetical protein